MKAPSRHFDLSVVVAAQNGGECLRRCLAAMTSMNSAGLKLEIVVVAQSGIGLTEADLREFALVRMLEVEEPANVPQLWKDGIAAAQGEIVALTIENCVPAHDWAQCMVESHRACWLGIGGAIELCPSAGIVDWAVYFTRYSSYMLPFTSRHPDDLPADNCSYKREALERSCSVAVDGFWETFVHMDMRSRGEGLLLDPSIVVRYAGGLTAPRFLKRRFLHGRYFAARRSLAFSLSQRLLRAVLFPAVWGMLLSRVCGRVWRNGRHRHRLAICLPLIASFLAAWAAGEAAGYLAGAAANKAPLRD